MDKETLLDLYNRLGSVSAVARHLGRDISTMRYHFVRAGIPITRGYRSPKSVRSYGSEHHNWKGGLLAHAEGYVLEYTPDHPAASANKGYVLQHRLVMERLLGRRLTESELVHHINGDKADNRPENLEIKSRSQHIRDHKAVAARDQRGRFA